MNITNSWIFLALNISNLFSIDKLNKRRIDAYCASMCWLQIPPLLSNILVKVRGVEILKRLVKLHEFGHTLVSSTLVPAAGHA